MGGAVQDATLPFLPGEPLAARAGFPVVAVQEPLFLGF